MGQGVEGFPYLQRGRSRDIVAQQTGFGSGRNYEKAKFISEHGDEESIARLDAGESSINREYELFGLL